MCNENFEDTRKYFLGTETPKGVGSGSLPIIYFVTPTYPRREQIAELTRLGQTLMHVPQLHWIVADDFDGCNLFLDYLLNRFGMFILFFFILDFCFSFNHNNFVFLYINNAL